MTAAGEAIGPWPQAWLERLRRRLGQVRGPLVQVWGWPGSGKGLLLRALGETEGLEVPPAALADPETLESAAITVRDQGLSYLLCRQWPGPGLLRGLPRLSSRPLVVFTSRCFESPEGAADEASVECLGPRELALEPGEIDALWRQEAGEALDGEALRRLWKATDGWLRPLELAARAAAAGQPTAFDAPSLAALPAVQSFLETEVLMASGASAGEVRRALLGLEDPSPSAVAELRRRGMLDRDPTGSWRRPFLLEALGGIYRSGGKGEGGGTGVPEERPLDPAPEAAAITFRMQFFGPPQVWRQDASGRHRIALRLRRALKIFAFLLEQPDHRATRLQLIEAAFAEDGLEAVRRNFHPTLSTLRRTLGAGSREPLRVLPFREGSYELDPGHRWEVDGDRFLELSASARRHRRAGRTEAAVVDWRQAWKLYRGPYLDGYEEGWMLHRREALYRAYLELLRDLGDALAELERLPAALDAYRALLVEDPLQEAVQVLVMGLYAAQGRRDLVRRQYDRLSKLLNEELGVEPLQATTLAYHRLMG